MIRHDAEGAGVLVIGSIFFAAQLLDLGQDAGESIGFIHALFAVEHADGAFQTHAGIHVLLRQGNEGAVLLLVILHKHVVPDFQIRAAVAGRGAIRAARLLGDDKHLGVRAAGAGHTGRTPPVVLLGQIEQMIVLYAALAPQVSRFLVTRAILIALKHGEGQLVRVDAQPFGAG